MSNESLEEGTRLFLDFTKLRQVWEKVISCGEGVDVVPVAIQNAKTKEVLIIAFTNTEAFFETITSGKVVLWSTSRNELWRKGATSGSYLELVSAKINCEQNSLVYKVKPRAGACHTKKANGRFRDSCFYREIVVSGENIFLKTLPEYM